MGRGDILPPESRTLHDPETDATIRQITSVATIHHHPFYYIPAYDKAMSFLCFVSHRTGRPEIFLEMQDDGRLVQATDNPDLNEWSVHPDPAGRYVYFTAGSRACLVSVRTQREEVVAELGGANSGGRGVGACMGTTALSHDGDWWAVPVLLGTAYRMYMIDTRNGLAEPIAEQSAIAHPQFHPDDADRLRYGGPYDRRIWVCNRDGSGNRLVYSRDATRKEWIVHESWVPNSREILTVNWPHGVMTIDTESGTARWVTRFPAWHPAVSPCGRFACADTTFPDTGLHLIDLCTGEVQPLCETLSSNAGAHWDTDHCPYDDGPVDVNAPQHTHPHPSISPDGKRVLFTSDRSGTPQLYEVTLPR